MNDSFPATTALLASGEVVYCLKPPFQSDGKTYPYPAGAIYIPAKPSTAAHIGKLAKERGLSFEATTARPQGDAFKLKPVRIALWDRYGGSMDSGWIRWLFEQTFRTPYERVYAPALDAGDL